VVRNELIAPPELMKLQGTFADISEKERRNLSSQKFSEETFPPG
jgi:hypothetical protein